MDPDPDPLVIAYRYRSAKCNGSPTLHNSSSLSCWLTHICCLCAADHGGVQSGALRSDPLSEWRISAGESPEPGPAGRPARQRYIPEGTVAAASQFSRMSVEQDD